MRLKKKFRNKIEVHYRLWNLSCNFLSYEVKRGVLRSKSLCFGVSVFTPLPQHSASPPLPPHRPPKRSPQVQARLPGARGCPLPSRGRQAPLLPPSLLKSQPRADPSTPCCGSVFSHCLVKHVTAPLASSGTPRDTFSFQTVPGRVWELCCFEQPGARV